MLCARVEHRLSGEPEDDRARRGRGQHACPAVADEGDDAEAPGGTVNAEGHAFVAHEAAPAGSATGSPEKTV